MSRLLMPRLLPIMVLLLLLAVWVLQCPLTAGGGPAAQLEACQTCVLVVLRRSSVVARRIGRVDGVCLCLHPPTESSSSQTPGQILR